MTEEVESRVTVEVDGQTLSDLMVWAGKETDIVPTDLGEVLIPTPPLLNLRDHPELMDVPIEIQYMELKQGEFGPWVLLYCLKGDEPTLIATGARLVVQRLAQTMHHLPLLVRFTDLGGYFTVEGTK